MNLTDAQLDAYMKLDPEEGQTARQIGARMSTLEGLVRRGLATKTSSEARNLLPNRDRFMYKKVVL